MINVTYEYYRDTYKGKLIPQDEFDVIARKAGYLLDAMTFGRLKNASSSFLTEDIIARVSDCLCEIADKLQMNTEDGVISEGVKTSETVANWSQSYLSASLPKSLKANIKASVDMYLGGTFLTCAWV